MSKEKQIEGLAEAVRIGKHAMCDVCSPNGRDCEECETDRLVNAIYNAGYRKQIEGEWEKVMNHRECSKCHYRAPYKKIKNGYFLQDLTAYCPNCGAKMKGV